MVWCAARTSTGLWKPKQLIWTEILFWILSDISLFIWSDHTSTPCEIYSRQTIAMMGFWCQAVWSGPWAMGWSDGDQRSYLTSQWQGCKIFAMIVHTPIATPTSTSAPTSTTATATVYLSIVNWAAELSAVLLFPSSTLHLNLLCPFWLWPPPPKETGQCRDLDKVCDHISVFNWLKLTETRVWIAAETFIQKNKLAIALGSSVTITKSYVVKLRPSSRKYEKMPPYLCCISE